MAYLVFLVAMVALFYTYVGYPLIVSVFGLFTRREVRRGSCTPDVTVIIPVHDAETLIARKIANCLQFEYPKDKLKIIVVSDASVDRTEDIVSQFSSQRVEYMVLPRRGGKVAAQNLALQYCTSEIVVFTDVAILNDPDCISLTVENFSDPTVGLVSCRDVIIGNRGSGKGEKQYIQYDMLVRGVESRAGSLIGVTGGFYAVRLDVARGGWNPAFPPDFYVAIRSIRRGLRVIEDPRVRAYYSTASREWDELPRKVRTFNRGMHTLFSRTALSLLNPFSYGLVPLELVSHKLLRWLTPLFLIMLFVSTLLLLPHEDFAVAIFIPQAIICLIGLVSVFAKSSSSPILRLHRYMVITLVAMCLAWFEFLSGKRYVIWQPTSR